MSSLRRPCNMSTAISSRNAQRARPLVRACGCRPTHIMPAQFVWVAAPVGVHVRPAGDRLHCERLEPGGHLVGRDGRGLYASRAAYQNGGGNVNFTGSPDFAPRVRVVGDPAAAAATTRCGSSTPAPSWTDGWKRRPRVGERLLEGMFHQQHGYRDCPHDQTGGQPQHPVAGRRVQPVQSGRIIARQTTMNLTSPSDPATITNLPLDAAGNVIDARVRPSGAGFRGRHRLSAAAHDSAAGAVCVRGTSPRADAGMNLAICCGGGCDGQLTPRGVAGAPAEQVRSTRHACHATQPLLITPERH